MKIRKPVSFFFFFISIFFWSHSKAICSESSQVRMAWLQEINYMIQVLFFSNLMIIPVNCLIVLSFRNFAWRLPLPNHLLNLFNASRSIRLEIEHLHCYRYWRVIGLSGHVRSSAMVQDQSYTLLKMHYDSAKEE